MPASSAAHSRKSERRLQQKNLIFCSFAHILFTFCDFVDFLSILRLKHQQQPSTIIDYNLRSKAPLSSLVS
ncbi:hypothetical protein GKR64_04910 [Providencia sp. wls1938]|nr:hypothetical protein [Providencia sp. wls1950]MTC22223.1 hypothetical protein [Providencia sp. wls1938]MTC77248.1 hypothetical protein [Providencia sp. wls1916]